MIQYTNNIPELQSPFELLREIDADGKEWWNSCKLARVWAMKQPSSVSGRHKSLMT